MKKQLDSTLICLHSSSLKISILEINFNFGDFEKRNKNLFGLCERVID
jgi:hypothetical protein